MLEALPIKADDPSVLSLYHKQKLECRFNRKTDNDFILFLLDAAKRVVSIGETWISDWIYLILRFLKARTRIQN